MSSIIKSDALSGGGMWRSGAAATLSISSSTQLNALK
eukprot:CAMPEP_0179450222 /NCGR_PEP_ID=MMETSP0799-20121207/34130_2 /TAXON_ID=46947 /ORGANISM="Geminigera cryophila, Strain CCMP2564" /LENGTH=36 /DNA_ID= /DNA_START= /DNA_END= /DNA_ORIENTATION=